MGQLPTRNVVFRTIWKADGFVSSMLFEIWDGLKCMGSAYSSFLFRYFRVSGPKRTYPRSAIHPYIDRASLIEGVVDRDV